MALNLCICIRFCSTCQERYDYINVFHYAGPMPEAAVANILATRLAYMRDEILQELLEIDGVEDCLQESDKKDLQKIARDGQIDTNETKEFAKQLKEHRARHREAQPPVQSRGRGKGKGKCSRAESDSVMVGGKRFSKALPAFTSDFSPAMFNAILPPGIRSAKESYHGRWRIYWTHGGKSRSATWDLYGWQGSIKLLLREAWTDFGNRSGEECPFSGVITS